MTQRAFPLPGWSRLRFSLAWFAALVVFLLVANATLFPWSESGIPSDLLRRPIAGPVRLHDLISIALILAVLAVLVRNLRKSPRWRTVWRRIALYGAVALLLVMAIRWYAATAAPTTPASSPNIILIGVDSLRPDVVGSAGRAFGVTPNIDLFLREGAHHFSDTVTPLARTFPAWTSILSGRYPRRTGARENLVSLTALEPFDSMAKLLRERGYHTILATDEVRFSNIDESFGFDRVIAPTMGAADFLLGKANDFPLSNLLANTRLGGWLFPATYANRAAAHVYRPQTFIDRLQSSLDIRSPTMLAVHFTLPHHPFHWADPGNTVFDPATDRAYQYLDSVIAADAQFGALMKMLDESGALQNAIVILLSDHGEALGQPSNDALLSGAVARDMLDGTRISLHGHGSSVLSPHQYAVLLAIRGYGASELPAARVHPEPVSLVDIAPTVLDLAGIEAPPADGLSLRPLLSVDGGPPRFAQRLRFTETGFRTPLLAAGDFDERGVLGEAAAYFRMNKDNARFEVRPELMPVLLADKERAVLSSDWLLASVPSRTDPNRQKYVMVSRKGAAPRRIEAPPGEGDDAELRRLWIALHEHYGDELLPPEPRRND
jgi:arylsulfatase A-like enzyme